MGIGEAIAEKTLDAAFYARDTVTVARELLGKLLVYNSPLGLTGGRIVETEAYLGPADPACHSARGYTVRNAVMFGPAGHAYIYQIYGMYLCLNITTDREDVAAAVLIRALEPVYGVDLMQQRCPRRSTRDLCRGPARLVQALGIDRELNGISVVTGPLRVVDNNAPPVDPLDIVQAARIGISKGNDLLLRFYLKGNAYVST